MTPKDFEDSCVPFAVSKVTFSVGVSKIRGSKVLGTPWLVKARWLQIVRPAPESPMYSRVNFRQVLFLFVLLFCTEAEDAGGHATAGTEMLYIVVDKIGLGTPFVRTGQVKG